MFLRRLEVDGVRNLCDIKLEGFGRVNVISGSNGSGKTSLLEAIYLLGMGRSFRSSRISPLINHNKPDATIFADLVDEAGTATAIGLLKSRSGDQKIRMNRQAVGSLAELARVLPLQLLDAEGFSLIDGGPKGRRQFMDWGVFHVKPGFMGIWRQAQRALRQRNELLRRGRVEMSQILPWEHELCRSAEDIDALRLGYLSDLRPHISDMLARFPSLPEVGVVYRRGWRSGSCLADELESGRQRDQELGYTLAGPHRATLEFQVAGRPAAEVLSRGQQKLVVACLKLAQAACLATKTGVRGIFLVDDLPSELDRDHRGKLCGLLCELRVQVFMTCVDADLLEESIFGSLQDTSGNVVRFHVEQGDYKCLTI